MIAPRHTTTDPWSTHFLGELVDADVSVVGTKAAALGRLRAAGLPVPDGFVLAGLTVASLERPEIREVVAAALDDLGPGRVAVRSSAAAEDLADA